MNNKLLAIAIAAAGITSLPVLSHAAEDKAGLFLNGNVGRSDLSKNNYDDSDTAYSVNLGYRWAVSPTVALGVEGGYVDLGAYSPKSGVAAQIPVGTGFRNAELKGWTAGVNGKFNLTDNWYVSARGGVFRADARGDRVIAGLPVRADAKSNEWYAGAGFGYDISRAVSVGLQYDYYKSDRKGLVLDPGMVSVGAEVRF